MAFPQGGSTLRLISDRRFQISITDRLSAFQASSDFGEANSFFALGYFRAAPVGAPAFPRYGAVNRRPITGKMGFASAELFEIVRAKLKKICIMLRGMFFRVF